MIRFRCKIESSGVVTLTAVRIVMWLIILAGQVEHGRRCVCVCVCVRACVCVCVCDLIACLL